MTSGVFAREADQWSTVHNCAICGSDIDDFIDVEKVRRRSDGAVVYVHTHCLAERRAGRKLTEDERNALDDERMRSIIAMELSGPLDELPPAIGDGPTDPEYTSRVHTTLARFAQRFDPFSGGSALLLGPSGAGKTLSANVLVRRLVADAIAAIPPSPESTRVTHPINRARWTTAIELTRARREHPLGQGDAPLVERAKRASLLVLDELGPEQDISTIFEVVDARYAQRRPTIATSGLTYPELAGRYGEALARRLSGKDCGALVDVHPPEAN